MCFVLQYVTLRHHPAGEPLAFQLVVDDLLCLVKGSLVIWFPGTCKIFYSHQFSWPIMKVVICHGATGGQSIAEKKTRQPFKFIFTPMANISNIHSAISLRSKKHAVGLLEKVQTPVKCLVLYCTSICSQFWCTFAANMAKCWSSIGRT